MTTWQTPPPHNDIIRITDDSSRADIEAAIAALRAKQERMPKAWEKRREEVADEIDALVGQWLAHDA